MQKRGLKQAIDYLNSMEVELVPDDLKKRAGLDIMVPTLAHSLRRAARQGQVKVVYKPDNKGVKIAYYKGNPDYKAQKQAVKGSTLYFYTIPSTCVPSPMFTDLVTMLGLMPKDGMAWKGEYDKPIPALEAE